MTRTDPVPPPEQPTTEASRALLDAPDVLLMISGDEIIGLNEGELELQLAAIEAEARAAERRAVVERIKREVPDDWTPWESDKADEAFGYNDALNRVRSILDAVATDTPGEPER
jgi:hypothetical protein